MKATIAEIEEYLRDQPSSEEAREWTTRARIYARILDSWATLGPDGLDARTLEGIMELHADVLKSCRRTTLAAPPREPGED